ncbi:MAG: GDSL family lipase [Rhodobacterales bacterium]|nr:MAG: GDSL family lipase [Rhodobacterales bacterium]
MPLAHDNIAKIALAPLLIAQALYVRQKALILPEPPGARSGTTGDGPPLRVLIAGDSSGAGVGASHQSRALSGQLATALGRHYRVFWQLEAATGATTRATLNRLRTLTEGEFDVAVLALGVNDVTRGVRLKHWVQDHAALADLLRNRFGVRRILVSGLPPMGQFPLLPQPLRRILGQTAQRFDTALAAHCARSPGITHLPFTLPFRPDYIARDGFHPSEGAYTLWADMVAGKILSSSGPSSD